MPARARANADCCTRRAVFCADCCVCLSVRRSHARAGERAARPWGGGVRPRLIQRQQRGLGYDTGGVRLLWQHSVILFVHVDIIGRSGDPHYRRPCSSGPGHACRRRRSAMGGSCLRGWTASHIPPPHHFGPPRSGFICEPCSSRGWTASPIIFPHRSVPRSMFICRRPLFHSCTTAAAGRRRVWVEKPHAVRSDPYRHLDGDDAEEPRFCQHPADFQMKRVRTALSSWSSPRIYEDISR